MITETLCCAVVDSYNISKMEDKKMSFEKKCFNHLMWLNDLDDNEKAEGIVDLAADEEEADDVEQDADMDDLDEDDDVYVDEMDRKLEHFYRQGDEAIAQLDKAGEDFERSLDEFTEGLEKMFDSLGRDIGCSA